MKQKEPTKTYMILLNCKTLIMVYEKYIGVVRVTVVIMYILKIPGFFIKLMASLVLNVDIMDIFKLFHRITELTFFLYICRVPLGLHVNST